MAATKYTGSGTVLESDFKYAKWVGVTKGGKAVTIELENVFCNSDPDWTFAEKNDTVPQIEFEACYDDAKLAAGDFTEPWTITLADGITAGNAEILLGQGKFYIGTSAATATLVGLTRGGGSFKVEREYREINADGDPGKVKDRVEQVGGRPKLTMNVLQWLTKVSTLYSGITTVTSGG